MSQTPVSIATPNAPVAPDQAQGASFVSSAKLIGFLTLVSRIFGMLRESVAANYFGAGAIWSAFTVAFTIPNLFRKLFGEGALSAAFIPLYAQVVRKNESPNEFSNASVNLLALILLALTLVGEAILTGLLFVPNLRADYVLAIQLTMIMLPYVLLVCGTALLSGLLQVHDRFAAAAASSIVLNVCLIAAILIAAQMMDFSTPAGQWRGVVWLSVSVLIAGVLQVGMLVPSLRAVGYRFRPTWHVWTPLVKRMLWLTLPVALSAGVLQVSVLLDKGISFLLAGDAIHTHFALFGWMVRYPMEEGAAARLNWAQFLYQFPLGVFAIALATAIFPRLSADAADADRTRFRTILRQGIEASLFIGLPASVGLIVVRYPAVRLLFEGGEFTYHDTVLVTTSTALYSAAVWAFSVQQILNRGYYALHDTRTPMVWAIVNLAINLVVELPLIWTNLGEAGMAAGTLVAFSVQAVVMTGMLARRVGGLGLRHIVRPIGKMLLASLVMWGACAGVQYLPLYPQGEHKLIWLVQLLILMGVGGGVYFGTCAALGLDVLRHLPLRRRKAARV